MGEQSHDKPEDHPGQGHGTDPEWVPPGQGGVPPGQDKPKPPDEEELGPEPKD